MNHFIIHYKDTESKTVSVACINADININEAYKRLENKFLMIGNIIIKSEFIICVECHPVETK